MTDISKEDLQEIRSIIDPNYAATLGRERLHENGLAEHPNLPELAMEWFQEICNNIGPLPHELWFSRRRPQDEYLEGAPPWVYYEDRLETPPLDEVNRIRIGDSQTLLVWRDRERTSVGYKPTVVRDEFFRIDMSILAVLTLMEGSGVEPKGSPYAYEGTEAELDYPKALLRYYRPDFDGLPPNQQKVLMAETYFRVYDVLEALRNLMAYLEYADPGYGLTRRPLQNPARDVRAAELKHIEGLKNYEVALRLEAEGLSLEPPKTYRDTTDYKEKYGRNARESAKRGVKILEAALGEEGWKDRVEKSRKAMKRWDDLDADDRLVERLADLDEDTLASIRHDLRPYLKDVFSRLRQGDLSVFDEMRKNHPKVVKHVPPSSEE